MSEGIERMLPLYEGKMGHQFDHRAASFTGVGDTDLEENLDHSPGAVVQPRYWVREAVVEDRLSRRRWGSRSALLGFRRVARNTDERTCIAAFVPFGAASYGWIMTAGPSAVDLALLAAEYNSFCFDFLIRQFLSQPSVPQGTFQQLPTVLRSHLDTLPLPDAPAWVVARVGLLTQGDEVRALRQELRAGGSDGWSESRRQEARAELDAAMFHAYDIDRDDVDYIMDTFPIVRRKDEAAYGEYRTKQMILAVYDAMAEAMRTGTAYTSEFDELGERVD